MRYIKTFILCLLLLIALHMVSYANEPRCDFTLGFSDGKITATVLANPNEHCAFQVLAKDVDIKSLDTDAKPGELAAHTGDFVTDKTGKAEVKIKLKSTGEYVLYVRSISGKTVYDFPFTYVKSGDYVKVIGKLNEAIEADDKTEFGRILFDTDDDGMNNVMTLGFASELVIDANKDEIRDMLMEQYSQGIDSEDHALNTAIFNAAAAIAALNANNSATPDNLFEYVKPILAGDDTMMQYIDKHVKDTDAQKYFTSKLRGKNVKDIDDLKAKSLDALILTAVKYPDGNMNIKNIFESYKDNLGLSSVSSASEVYISLGGREFSTTGDLITAYKAALPANNSNPGKGKNDGSSTTSSGFSSVTVPQSNNAGAAALGIPFVDLDTVDWEYPSISRLYAKGIVNGVNEYEFKPDLTVKREEFVKMLICAMGLGNEQYTGNVFNDVSGTWCEKYVCIAYEKGITNGISGDTFGMGEQITRQDMAVMIYKAMVIKGYESKNAENNFSDKDSIAQYAAAPVAELSSLGIVNGMGDNKYVPYDKATRAQTAVIIDRALQYLQ